MNELLKIRTDKQGEQVVSGRALHEFLEVETQYSIWFKRMLEYDFVENVDYVLVNQKRLTNNPKNPETTYTDHLLKIDMAKELCMLQRTEKGKQARRYFIKIEKAYKQWVITREVGKAARRSLTDAIKENVPDSPHKKFAYKNYTDLVYRNALGCSCKKLKEEKGLDRNDNLRDFLDSVESKAVKSMEECVRSLVDLGYDYQEIKDIISRKRLKEDNNGKSLFD